MQTTDTKTLSRINKIIHAMRKREYLVYSWLSVGIIYSMLFWPLLNSLCVIGLFLFWAIVSKKQLPQSRSRKILLFVFISLYVVFLVGMLYTENINEGTFRLQQRLPLVLFPIIYGTTLVMDSRMQRKILMHFLMATILACAVSVLVNIVMTLINGEAMPDGSKIFIFRDSYPYMIGLMCLTSIVIAFSQMRVAGTRILLVSAVIFLSAFLLLLSVRLVIAVWAAVVVLKTIEVVRSNMARALITCVIVCSIVGGITYIPKLNNQWHELIQLKHNTIPLDTDSSQGRSWGGGAIRIAIWQSSGDLTSDHWLTGVGTGDVQDSLQQAYRNRQFYFASEYNKYNAHNQYLQTLLGNGIAGLLSLILCILLPLVYLKSFNMRFDYMLFLMVFAAICMTESILDINKGIIWYSFFNSIFAFSISGDKSTKSNTYDRQLIQAK